MIQNQGPKLKKRIKKELKRQKITIKDGFNALQKGSI